MSIGVSFLFFMFVTNRVCKCYCLNELASYPGSFERALYTLTAHACIFTVICILSVNSRFTDSAHIIEMPEVVEVLASSAFDSTVF